MHQIIPSCLLEQVCISIRRTCNAEHMNAEELQWSCIVGIQCGYFDDEVAVTIY
jgi:hypothetical protein